MENRALGKGLSALIPDSLDSKKPEGIRQIKITDIKNNAFQPRKNYDDAKLADLMVIVFMAKLPEPERLIELPVV